MATLKLPVFWSSRKLTSLRGPCASALPPLTIFHSLSALQPWHHCTQIRHRTQRSRRCCIPAQHRLAAMTRPPALPPRLLRASCRQMWQLTSPESADSALLTSAQVRASCRERVHASECDVWPGAFSAPSANNRITNLKAVGFLDAPNVLCTFSVSRWCYSMWRPRICRFS
jgi:hypothetical protein